MGPNCDCASENCDILSQKFAWAIMVVISINGYWVPLIIPLKTNQIGPHHSAHLIISLLSTNASLTSDSRITIPGNRPGQNLNLKIKNWVLLNFINFHWICIGFVLYSNTFVGTRSETEGDYEWPHLKIAVKAFGWALIFEVQPRGRQVPHHIFLV